MKQDQHICWKKENIIFLIDYIFYKLFLQFLLKKNSLRGKDLSPYYVEPDQPCRGRKAGEYKKRRYVVSLQNLENWKLTIDKKRRHVGSLQNHEH